MTKLLCTTADGDMQIVRIEESDEWQRDWGRAVVGAALADPTKLSAHRDKMVLFSSLLLLFALRISVVPVAFCVSPWHLDVFAQDCTGGGFRVLRVRVLGSGVGFDVYVCDDCYRWRSRGCGSITRVWRMTWRPCSAPTSLPA